MPRHTPDSNAKIIDDGTLDTKVRLKQEHTVEYRYAIHFTTLVISLFGGKPISKEKNI